MTYADLDARLAILLADEPPIPDDGFAARIVALAAFDQAERKARTRAFRRIGTEAIALVAVLATFVVLARAAPSAIELGDSIPLASPAMFGITMLALWALVGLRPATARR
jgi:hypothetical protein